MTREGNKSHITRTTPNNGVTIPVNLQTIRTTQNQKMVKRTKKSKGRGSKLRGTVSSKHEPTPYNRAREALKVK